MAEDGCDEGAEEFNSEREGGEASYSTGSFDFTIKVLPLYSDERPPPGVLVEPGVRVWLGEGTTASPLEGSLASGFGAIGQSIICCMAEGHMEGGLGVGLGGRGITVGLGRVGVECC